MVNNNIEQRLDAVHQQIRTAEKRAGRTPHSVRLIAVSKQQPISVIKDAIAAGQKEFGENYLQEALEKINALTDKNLIWHFIGDIQSNKTRAIAENFSWVHSVDRLKIAQRLSQQRPSHLAPLNICIQVNTNQEKSKSGVSFVEIDSLIEQIYQLPHLQLRGFMALPDPQLNADELLAVFTRLQQILNNLKEKYPFLDSLSMGMSKDLSIAIAGGATLVRVGTAIFGERTA